MIILDSSFLIAYKVEDDKHHARAREIAEEIGKGKFDVPVISDYIFDESITVIYSKTKSLEIASEFGSELLRDLKLVNVDKHIFEEAFEIFRNQEKTRFSFTNCTILAVMKIRGINHIASFDEDFLNRKDINLVY